MKQFKYIIKDENGIHARPAGLLVKEALNFESELIMESNGKLASLKRMFALMGLGVKQGNTVTITVEGLDEDDAVEKISAFMQKHF